MDRNTTIQISLDTKTLLDKLKVHPREPYDDVIRKLVNKASGRVPGSKHSGRKTSE